MKQPDSRAVKQISLVLTSDSRHKQIWTKKAKKLWAYRSALTSDQHCGVTLSKGSDALPPPATEGEIQEAREIFKKAQADALQQAYLLSQWLHGHMAPALAGRLKGTQPDEGQVAT